MRGSAQRLSRLAASSMPIPVGDPLENRDPRGLANTQRGVMLKRPTFHSMKDELGRLKRPLLVVSGDEDENCLAPSVFLKETCPRARLWVCPDAGHMVNLEKPHLFNQTLSEFLTLVES
jgi:pimeloyl-ACP methyl ester carboxylesterase